MVYRKIYELNINEKTDVSKTEKSNDEYSDLEMLELFEYLKDGIIVALGQENLIVMKYEEYKGIALVDEVLETCYAETLDLIFEVLQQHLSKECPNVNDGKYLEFMDDTYEIKI